MVMEGGQDTGDWEGNAGKSDGKVTESQGRDQEMWEKAGKKKQFLKTKRGNSKRNFEATARLFSKVRPHTGKTKN